MPLPKDVKIAFSRRIKAPSGAETLGIFGTKGKSKKIKLVDTRICRCPKDKSKKCICPRNPAIRNKLKKQLGL